MNKKVAFIGLGVMGFPMAGWLSKNGYSVAVYNRTTSVAKKWLDTYAGSMASSPSTAAEDAEIVFVCVGNDNDVLEVVCGEKGILSGIKQGAILVDHTTTSAELAKELAVKAKKHHCEFVDAPVSGGQQGAENGQLTVMCGGDEIIFNRVTDAINCYAKALNLLGPVGSGQLCKMVNQICIAGLLQGLSEGLLFAESENLNMDKLLSAISGGAAQSWQMVNRGKTMHQREFDFGFAIKWMVKDLGYCLDQAEGNNTKLAFTQEIYDRYTNLMDKGHTYSDTSALMMFDELNK